MSRAEPDHAASHAAAPASGASGGPRGTFDPFAITRPVPALMKHYLITSLLTGPGVLVALPILFFKYETLRYRFDADGVSVSWGILFRREVYLTYRRIQDIHVTRGIIQRWLGLATISLQTAAGSSQAEMQIEGVPQVEELRDFLYSRMRGAHDDHPAQPAHADAARTAPAAATSAADPSRAGAAPAAGSPASPAWDHATDASSQEAVLLLREILSELKARGAKA